MMTRRKTEKPSNERRMMGIGRELFGSDSDLIATDLRDVQAVNVGGDYPQSVRLSFMVSREALNKVLSEGASDALGVLLGDEGGRS